MKETPDQIGNGISKASKNQWDLIRVLDKIVKSDENLGPLALADSELDTLYRIARASKIPLYFLERLFEAQGDAFRLKDALDAHRLRYAKMLDLVKEAAYLFRNEQVEYAFFKTLRPFSSVGSDIDVLLFDHSLSRVLDFLPTKYEVQDICEDNATLYYPNYDLKLDLHASLSVSRFPYVDVDSIRGEVVEKILDEVAINVLTPEAEVIVTACHSVFKEQMLTLQDCYVLQQFLPLCDRDKILWLLRKNRVILAFELSTILAESILRAIRGRKPTFQLYSDAGLVGEVAKFEFTRLIRSDFHLPYRYSLYAVLASFAERALLSREGQRGATLLARHLFNKAFVRRLAARLPKHFRRSSY